MAVLLLLGSGATLAAGDDKQANVQHDMVHFVLIIDCTGSMDKADVEEMSVAAAELFVDMLPMDNATVSILCFGKLWQKTYEFKNGSLDEMKPFLDQNGQFNELLRADGKYITPLCETASLSSVTARSELKNKIEEANELLSANSITIANSAMLAAIDLLKSAHAEPGNACIVMMSDGRVQVDRREAMSAVTAINPYPCYVLELNYPMCRTRWFAISLSARCPSTRLPKSRNGKALMKRSIPRRTCYCIPTRVWIHSSIRKRAFRGRIDRQSAITRMCGCPGRTEPSAAKADIIKRSSTRCLKKP